MQIALHGATGRLGKLITELSIERDLSIFPIRSDLDPTFTLEQQLVNSAEQIVLLDVSLATGTLNLCKQVLNQAIQDKLLKKIVGIVIGTTGHSIELKELIQKVADKYPVCVVSNFSKGVYLFEEILRSKTTSGVSVTDFARQLGFDLAIHEVHHSLKKDAPSGTAVNLAKAGKIPLNRLSSTRVGSIIGEHTLYISTNDEQLEIKHTALTRRLFAYGAITICENIYARKPPIGFLNKDSFLL